MTEKNPYVARLEKLEKDLTTVKLQYAQLLRENELLRPMAEWAIKEVMREQEQRLELDKRLNIKRR